MMLHECVPHDEAKEPRRCVLVFVASLFINGLKDSATPV